jgi:hypothetical protein
MMDPRAFSEAQVQNRIDAFIEMMEENRTQKEKQIMSGGTGQWQTINR